MLHYHSKQGKAKTEALLNCRKIVACIEQAKIQSMIPGHATVMPHNQVRRVICLITTLYPLLNHWKDLMICKLRDKSAPFKSDSTRQRSRFVYLCASEWNTKSKAACNSVVYVSLRYYSVQLCVCVLATSVCKIVWKSILSSSRSCHKEASQNKRGAMTETERLQPSGGLIGN